MHAGHGPIVVPDGDRPQVPGKRLRPGLVLPPVQRPTAEVLARWSLAAVTLLLMASMGGGFLLLPALIPAHVWAARRSGRVGRIGWSVLPAASVAMVAWAAVYVTVRESEPAIWLLPAFVLVATFAVVARFVASGTPQQLAS